MTTAQLTEAHKHALQVLEHASVWKLRAPAGSEKQRAIEVVRCAKGLQAACEHALAFLKQATV